MNKLLAREGMRHIHWTYLVADCHLAALGINAVDWRDWPWSEQAVHSLVRHRPHANYSGTCGLERHSSRSRKVLRTCTPHTGRTMRACSWYKSHIIPRQRGDHCNDVFDSCRVPLRTKFSRESHSVSEVEAADQGQCALIVERQHQSNERTWKQDSYST